MSVKRRKPKKLEDALQVFCVNKLRALGGDDVIVAHVPNGGQRNAIVGANLKRSGVLAGFPDLIILWGGGNAGFVEFKKPDGKKATARKGNQATIVERIDNFGHKTLITNDASVFFNWVIDQGIITLTGFQRVVLLQECDAFQQGLLTSQALL